MVNEADAAARLAELHDAWGDKHPAIKGLCDAAWSGFVPFLDYSPEIRRVIYSTNAIESLNARMGRATRAREHFPTEHRRPRPPARREGLGDLLGSRAPIVPPNAL